jgi:hypothetical protein
MHPFVTGQVDRSNRGFGDRADLCLDRSDITAELRVADAGTMSACAAERENAAVVVIVGVYVEEKVPSRCAELVEDRRITADAQVRYAFEPAPGGPGSSESRGRSEPCSIAAA